MWSSTLLSCGFPPHFVLSVLYLQPSLGGKALTIMITHNWLENSQFALCAPSPYLSLFVWQVWAWHERPLRLTKFPIRTEAQSSASYKSNAKRYFMRSCDSFTPDSDAGCTGDAPRCGRNRCGCFYTTEFTQTTHRANAVHSSSCPISIYSALMFSPSALLLSATPGSLPFNVS